MLSETNYKTTRRNRREQDNSLERKERNGTIPRGNKDNKTALKVVQVLQLVVPQRIESFVPHCLVQFPETEPIKINRRDVVPETKKAGEEEMLVSNNLLTYLIFMFPDIYEKQNNKRICLRF